MASYPLSHAHIHTHMHTRMHTRTTLPRCYPHRVEGYNEETKGQMSATYRSYPEMFFSGALTELQIESMYRSGKCGMIG